MNPFMNQMLPGSGNSFADYLDRKEEERCRECDRTWLKCECEKED